MTNDEARMTNENPEPSVGKKRVRMGFLAPVSILLFVVFALVGAYFVRKNLLETAMSNAVKLEDKATVWDLARSFPCPVNARDEDNNTALHLAAQWGDRELAQRLIGKGADVNAKTIAGLTPLHFASTNETTGVAQLLLANGADIHARSIEGDTPLHFAAWQGEEDAVELFIASGGDVNSKNKDGGTPLHEAAYYGKKVVVELLIVNRADINAKYNDGQTPLHRAVYYGHKEVVELLIANGADINAKDNNGKTALQLAIDEGHDGVAELLRKAGASAVKPMPIIILKYYRSPDRTECLEDPYGFLISWNNSETPRFYVYDASRRRIDATGDFTEFLHLLSAFPDGVRVRWVNGCAGGFCWDMPKDKYDATEKLRAGKQWRYYDGEDTGSDYWRPIICTCETENVTFLEKAP